MKEYPRFVFTSPGNKSCQGGTYGEEIVTTEKDHASALAAGFFDSIPEALEALKAPKKEKVAK